jgi:urea transport system permease protein
VAAYGRAARRRVPLRLAGGGQVAPAAAPAEAVSAPAPPADFAGLVASLRDAGFADKEAIVERLVASGHASARVVLRALLEDRLVVRAPDQGVFVATSADETLPAADLLDPVTLKPIGSSPRDALTRIGTNNRLRRVLKGLVARTELANADPASA